MRIKALPRSLVLFAALLVCVFIFAVLLSRDAGFRVGASAQATPTPAGISPEAAEQIAALNREKDLRTAAQQKIDSRLLYAIKAADGRASLEGLPVLQTGIQPDKSGNIEVDIRTQVTKDLLERIESLGGRIIYSSEEHRTVVAEIPLRAVETVAGEDAVIFIGPKEENGPNSVASPNVEVSVLPTEVNSVKKLLESGATQQGTSAARLRVGSQTSEGDITHRAALARQLSGSDGTGVRIGVLSDGVSSLAARQASGDLPANVTVVVPGPAGTEEGTAMLEIVHDIAPGAQLFFATATGSGSAAFADNIRTLRNVHNCDIIVDDWTYFAETPFQEGQAPGVISPSNGGVVIQAVNDVTASGALFFSSAGNSGNKNDGTAGAWEGDFVNGGASAAPLPANLQLHDFGGGTLFNTVSLQSSGGAGTYLKWSDPLGGSANDYDFYVLDSTGTTVISASTNIQSGTQDPLEIVAQPTTGRRLVVARKVGAADRFLHINTNRGRLANSTSGVVHGHNSGRNTQTTAASPARGPFPSAFSTANAVETFSSDGPRRIFFNADSSPITPGNVSSTGGELLAKPDMTAADGVTTTTPGFLTFFGTSAAAPHAAAIAGLLKSENPALTASQISTAMKNSALDIEGPGYDRDSGAGITMPLRAMNAAGITGQAFIDRGAVVATQRIGDGDSSIEAGETWNLAVTLDNLGLLNASNVSATLTATTPGVTVIPSATRSYGSLAAAVGSGTNSVPFAFSLPTNFPCGGVVNFGLNITFTSSAGAGNVATTLSVGTGSPTAVTTTLDAEAPPASSAYTALTNNNQTSRLNRNGVISSCPTVKPTPVLQDAVAGRRFDQYTFTASADGCVTVTVSSSNIQALYSAAYNGTYNPANIQTNYLADFGVISTGNIQYSFPVTAGQQYVVVVHEVNLNGGNGVNYTLTVGGPRANGCGAPYSQTGEVTGRVLDRNSRAIARAIVTISDGGGFSQSVYTNTFGYWRFTGLPPAAYTITTQARRYTFSPVVVNVSGNLSGVEINPQP